MGKSLKSFLLPFNLEAVYSRMACLSKPLLLTNFTTNKKVLLRERKRHTARHVASTPYVVLSWLTPPRLDLTPPCQLDLTPPRRLDLTLPPRLDLIPPQLAGPDLPSQLDLTPPLAGPDPPGWTCPPGWTWPPHQLDLTPPSPPGWTWPPLPPLAGPDPPQLDLPPPQLDLSPPGQTDLWMDRRVSKHYLPSYYVRGR